MSITGIAGPGGATGGKPVGLVYFGCAKDGMTTITVEKKFGDIGRDEIREASVNTAFELLRQAAG